MSDLDELFDTLVADVGTSTRAPGAPAAIKQAHRRRRTIAATAAAAVAVIAVGGSLATGTLGGGDRISPAGPPEPASSKPPLVQESPKAPPGSDEFFRTEVGETLTQAPDWAVTDDDPTIIHPCGGSWSASATGGSGGNFDIGTPGEQSAAVWAEEVGFPSAARASDAAALLVENLTSCTALAWQPQPIADTGAVLASSAIGVIWIQQRGATVAMLQVPTIDGPPPLDVQVEVADLLRVRVGVEE